MVECVKDHAAELETHRLCKVPVLHDRRVPVLIAGAAEIGEKAWSSSEGSVGSIRKRSGIEPLADSWVRYVRIGNQIRPRITPVRVVVRSIDTEWDTRLESSDLRELPASNHGVFEAIHVRSNGTAAANRQLIDVVGHKTVRRIRTVHALFSRHVGGVGRARVAGARPGVVTLNVIQELGVGI